DFFIKRKNNILPVEEKLSHEDYASQLRELQYEIFIPAAASRLINRSHVMDMIKAKVEVISSGANVPFDDPEIFIGSTGLYADEKISVLPDFIANCGMARVFAHLMEEELELTDENIFNDVSDRIRIALENVHQINPEKEKIVRSALKLALSQLV
ncbi:MAG: amino acid dehydrogenase, partial [Cyclobacteriaceae bacterium]|nr:amino acid dehydrogenase [Cyclobacteriaceae bacterium]